MHTPIVKIKEDSSSFRESLLYGKEKETNARTATEQNSVTTETINNSNSPTQ